MATKDKLINLEDMKAVRDHDMAIVDNKADKVGFYPDLIAGTADNLLSSSYQTDRTPYIIRRTPFGTRQKGTIVGGSIVWNQLVEHGNFDADTGWQWVDATASVSDNIATMTPTKDTSRARRRFTRAQNHVYFAKCMIKGTEGEGDVNMWGGPPFGSAPLNGAWVDVGGITKAASGGTYYIDFSVSQNTNMASWQVKDCTLFDLTLMFGTEIADYIYTREQATAGTGVALAKAWAGLTSDYYPYDAGSIKSVTGVTAHRMTGKNIFGGLPLAESVRDASNSSTIDTSAGFVTFDRRKGSETRVIYDEFEVGKRYTFFLTFRTRTSTMNNSMRVYYTDGSETIVRADSQEKTLFYFTTTAGKSVDKFVLSYYTVGAAELYYDESGIFEGVVARDAFEPYTAHTYPLDSSLTLRGLPKLDGDSIYYDGDVYPPSGEVERRYGVVDIGTLNWSYNSAEGNQYFFGNVAGKALGNFNILCDKYVLTEAAVTSAMTDKEIKGHATSRAVFIKDSAYTDAATFKASLTGVYLVYELDEPTTEQAEPYTALQICDPVGTEEFVGASMPVGHETKYYADLKGKIEDIPDAPSADGTYTLKVTVSNGVATYSWG